MTYKIDGKEVGDIAFGLMGLTITPGLSEETAITAIKAAVDAGCNYLDAGEFYGTPEHNSLTLMRKYFDKYPEDAEKIVLNVKGAYLGYPKFEPNGSKEATAQSIKNCIRMLGPRGYIHEFEPARKDLNVNYEDDTLATIESFVNAGQVGSISCSEINASTLRSAAKKFKITSVEVELSLFTTDALTNGLLEAAGELGIQVLAYAPLSRGFLTGQIKKPEDLAENDPRRRYPRFQGDNFFTNLKIVEKVEELAKKKGCTPAQIAINWLLALSRRPGMPRITPLPGSSNPARIRENATIIELSDEDLREIDQLLASVTPAGERYPAVILEQGSR